MTDQPDIIEVQADKPFRMSPNAMRALRKATGQPLTEILQGDDDETRWQAVAFGELHRRLAALGHLPDAGELWERAGNAVIELQAPEGLDPFAGVSSTTSQPSAVTGE